jgi:rhamnosyltransferase
MYTHPFVNIIVRTYNEENWIKFCLLKLLEQNYENYIITVVDSGSADATKQIVGECMAKNQKKIILETIEVYKPGNAINLGASITDSDYFICLSAHCIPDNSEWIATYVDFMEVHTNVAGAYGQQLPLGCTQADDARDMMITFGFEQRINNRDYFFHNANSIIRTSFWSECPFDDEVLHVEDQVWAKKVIEKGFSTAYLPQAAVYHYHGMHQHGSNKSFRAVNVLKVMNSLEISVGFMQVCTLIEENIDVPLVILVPKGDEGKQFVMSKLDSLVKEYMDYSEIFLVSNSASCGESNEYICINRSTVDTKDSTSLRDLMRNVLLSVEDKLSRVVDGLIFYDLSYRHIDPSLGKKCNKVMFNQYHAAVMPAWKDYGNYWIQNEGRFENIQSTFDLREEKPALYRSVLGQGGAIRASALRSNIKEISIGEVIWTEDTSILSRESTNV